MQQGLYLPIAIVAAIAEEEINRRYFNTSSNAFHCCLAPLSIAASAIAVAIAKGRCST